MARQDAAADAARSVSEGQLHVLTAAAARLQATGLGQVHLPPHGAYSPETPQQFTPPHRAPAVARTPPTRIARPPPPRLHGDYGAGGRGVAEEAAVGRRA
jgi:hypothetical protein